MKILKNPIFTFLLGIIISGSVVFAVTSINASNITYTDKNNNEVRLDQALDSIYSNLNTKMLLNTLGTPIYNVSQGNMATTRNDTITLNKGKYLVVKLVSTAFHTSSTTEYATSTEMSNVSNAITCNKSCITQNVFSYTNRIKTTGTITTSTSSYYTINITYNHLFYIEITEDNTVLTGSATANSAATTSTQQVALVAVPINE